MNLKTTLAPVWTWLHQTTTVIGLAGLAADAAGYFSGATDLKETGLLLVPAAVALVLPGSAAAPAQARKMLLDLLALVAARGTGATIPAFAGDVIAFAGALHPDTPVVPLSALTTVQAPKSAA